MPEVNCNFCLVSRSTKSIGAGSVSGGRDTVCAAYYVW